MALDSFRRPEAKKSAAVSSGLKMALLIAVILGLYMRSCYFKNKEKYITFENIRYEANLPGGCDVLFDVNNKTSKKGKEYVFVTLYDGEETPIATKLAQIYMHPNKVKTHRIVLTKFDRRIEKDDYIGKATVEFHKPSLLKRN